MCVHAYTYRLRVEARISVRTVHVCALRSQIEGRDAVSNHPTFCFQRQTRENPHVGVQCPELKPGHWIVWFAGFLIAMIQKELATYDLRLSGRWLSDRPIPSCLG